MEDNTVVNNAGAQKGFNPMIIVVILILLALIGAAVMMAGNKTTTQTTNVNVNPTEAMSPEPTEAMMVKDETGTMAKESITPAETGTMADVMTVNVEAGSYYYKPSEIRVKKGQKVKIMMKSVDMIHNFNIDELNVKVPLTKSGETATAEFIADKVGAFEYYCSVGSHRANGQVGKLIVE